MARYIEYGPHSLLALARGAHAEAFVQTVVNGAADEMAAEDVLQIDKGLDKAQRVHEHCRVDFVEVERRIATEEANRLLGKRGSHAKAILYRLAGIVSIVAEFALLWSTLAWVLSMPPGSPLTFCAAAAPLAVTVVLVKEPLERLAHAAYHASIAPQRTLGGTALLVLEYLFLLVTLSSAMLVSGLLGNMREVARRAREALAQGDAYQLSAADQAAVLVTILGVTLLVAVGGAACFAYGSVYGWAAKLRNGARRALEDLRPERTKKCTAMRDAEIARGAAVIDRNHVRANAPLQATIFKATQEALLAIERARPADPPKEQLQPAETLDSVEPRLSARLLAAKTARRAAAKARERALST